MARRHRLQDEKHSHLSDGPDPVPGGRGPSGPGCFEGACSSAGCCHGPRRKNCSTPFSIIRRPDGQRSLPYAATTAEWRSRSRTLRIRRENSTHRRGRSNSIPPAPKRLAFRRCRCRTWTLPSRTRWQASILSRSAKGGRLTQFHAFYDHERALPLLAERDPGPQLWMSRDDALRRGLADGDAVRVYNQRGSFETSTRLTEQIPAGVVWMRDGCIGLNRVTSGARVLPETALDLFLSPSDSRNTKRRSRSRRCSPGRYRGPPQ